MLLKEELQGYIKEDLLDIAYEYGLRNCSKLRKADLVDRLVECICDAGNLRAQLVCLTRSEMEIFRKGCKGLQAVYLKSEIFDSMLLKRRLLGGFDEETDRFGVFDEIIPAFNGFDDAEFKKEQRKKGWIAECMRFLFDYYGVAPVEIIYKLYSLKEKDTIEEMNTLLLEIPRRIFGVEYAEGKSNKKISSPESPLHTEYGYLIADWVLEEGGMLEELLDQQGAKDFYIPTVRQIEQLYYTGYDQDSKAYKRLKSYMINNLHCDANSANLWCTKLWYNGMEGESPMRVLQEIMDDCDVDIDDSNQFNELAGFIMDAHNNTRMQYNRGFMPAELTQNRFANGGRPTIVPGSSLAAEMLQEAAPELEKRGFTVENLGKKVYPNDPCPCGSGKKYKKCCGRRY